MNSKQKKTLLVLIFLSGASIIFINANGLGPASPSCFEIGTCDIFSDPLNAMLKPWVEVLGPIFYIIIWGLILGIIWLRTHSALLVGVLGLIIAGFLTAGPTLQYGAGALDCASHDLKCLNNISVQIILVGAGLMAVSIAVVLYEIFFVKINYPSG